MHVLLRAIGIVGYPFAWALNRIRPFGDGTGNESGLIALQIWSILFGAIIWILFVAGLVWMCNHISISTH